jgi:Uma2 family endonuclease
MSIIVSPQESRVVIRNLSWETYETLLRERGDEGPRMAFDGGTLEVMSPSSKHEKLKTVLARLVEAFSEELNIDIGSTGSTTFKSQLKEKGLEPDESYYIQNEARVRGKEIDLAVDPPPDLAIEIDLRSSALDKLKIYEALGVPEVWSHDGERVVVHRLQASGQFAVSDSSAALPELPMAELGRFLERIGTESETGIVRAFRSWVRSRFGTR